MAAVANAVGHRAIVRRGHASRGGGGVLRRRNHIAFHHVGRIRGHVGDKGGGHDRMARGGRGRERDLEIGPLPHLRADGRIEDGFGQGIDQLHFDGGGDRAPRHRRKPRGRESGAAVRGVEVVDDVDIGEARGGGHRLRRKGLPLRGGGGLQGGLQLGAVHAQRALDHGRIRRAQLVRRARNHGKIGGYLLRGHGTRSRGRGHAEERRSQEKSR